jgi:hypothetical protein
MLLSPYKDDDFLPLTPVRVKPDENAPPGEIQVSGQFRPFAYTNLDINNQ